MDSPEIIEIERSKLETLVTNIQSLKRQRSEMLNDIKSVVENFAQLGEQFQDSKAVMKLIQEVSKAMLLKNKQSQGLFETLLGPTSAFVSKYAPIVYPDNEPLKVESNES